MKMTEDEQRLGLASFGASCWFLVCFFTGWDLLAIFLHAFMISLPIEALSIEGHGMETHLINVAIGIIIIYVTCRSPKIAWSTIKQEWDYGKDKSN
jgi:hypothetical protein